MLKSTKIKGKTSKIMVPFVLFRATAGLFQEKENSIGVRKEGLRETSSANKKKQSPNP
jgi:hypothetical protein